jgi:hypothetical protein
VDTLQLLKQEINQSTDSLHDFAKWKLIVTSALAAAALGLTTRGKPYYSLVLLIPYACAYVDLNSYQHLIRIAVLARFLREQGGDKYLRNYERQCEELRTSGTGVFNLMIYGQLLSSLAMSIVAPFWALVSFAGRQSWRAEWESLPTCFRYTLVGLWIVIWLLGVCLVLGLWVHYRSKDKATRTKPLKDEAPLAKFNGPFDFV